MGKGTSSARPRLRVTSPRRKKAQAELQKAKDELEQRVLDTHGVLAGNDRKQLETFCYAHRTRPAIAIAARSKVSRKSCSTITMKVHSMRPGAIMPNAFRTLALRLDMLVHDLLTYSRLSRSELKFDRVDLGKLVEDVEAALIDQTRAKKATISRRSFLPGASACIDFGICPQQFVQQRFQVP